MFKRHQKHYTTSSSTTTPHVRSNPMTKWSWRKDSDMIFIFFIVLVLFVTPVRLLVFVYEVAPNTSIGTGTPKYRLDLSSLSASADHLNPPIPPPFLPITLSLEDDLSSMDDENMMMNSLDDYNNEATPCTDFYSKVCSLHDDPLVPHNHYIGDDESIYTTGTFKDMIETNNEVIQAIIGTGYLPIYKECLLFNETTRGDTIDEYYINLIKSNHISTLYDVWRYGGYSLFTINPMEKVLDAEFFAVEFDINFNILNLNSKVIPLEVQVLLTSYYMELINLESYMYNLGSYERVIDIKPERLRTNLIQLFGLNGESIVMLHGQHVFLDFCFGGQATTEVELSAIKLLLQIPTIQQLWLNEGGWSLIPQKVQELYHFKNQYLAELGLKPHNYNTVTLNFANNGVKKSRYCQESIRELYFHQINAQYYFLTNAKEYANDLSKMIHKIVQVSEWFFANKTGQDLSSMGILFEPTPVMSIPEFSIWISNHPKKMELAVAKMQNIQVISMASTTREFITDLAKEEIAALYTYKDSWLDTFHYGSLYKNTRNVQKVLAVTGVGTSESYLQARERLSNITWLTVRAETVNAWYNPTMNTITIPIGITRYPMFRNAYYYDLALIGSVIGHELGHATDASGIQFDENGTWIGKTREEEEGEDGGEGKEESDTPTPTPQESCLIVDYGKACGNQEYGLHTLGEDMADQFGLRMVLIVLTYDMLGINTTGLVEVAIQNLNTSATKGDFLLSQKILYRDIFINFARVWCGRNTFSKECDRIHHDVHAVAKHRVIKTLRQFFLFQHAFNCKSGDGMVNPKPCLVY